MGRYNYSFSDNPPYWQVEANFIPNLQPFYDDPDKFAIAPFRIYGNLYYVGDQKVTSHLIDTGDGLILFDTGYGNTTHMLLDSIRSLGFDPMDIRYIIHSHGHFDHFGSGNELRALTGAKVCMSAVDTRLLREKPERALIAWGPRPNDDICWPDIELEDGDHIRLGNTDITCVLSAGHTCGTMTFFFDAVEDGNPLRVGYLGGAGLLTVYKDFCKKFDLPLNKSQMLRNTLHMLKGYHVDIMLGNHPSQNRTLEKRQWMLDHPGENDFLDPSAWPEFLAAQLTRLDDFDAKGY